jgi:hypothetical protein
MSKLPDPYDHTEFRGRPGDYATAAACVEMEVKLGYRLTLMQFIGGAPQSAGTHLDGRAVDLAPYDATRKERVGRDVLGVGWHRPENWDHDGGGEHVHLINVFVSRSNQRGITGTGWRQIGYFDRGLNGLASSLKDPNPYRPSPKVVFTLDDYERVMTTIGLDGGPLPTLITKQRDALVEADADLGTFISLSKSAKADKSEYAWAQRERVQIRHRLDVMSKR